MIYELNEAKYIYSVGDIKENINMDTIIGKYFTLNGFKKTMSSSKLRLTKLSKFEDKAEGLPLYLDFIESLKNREINVGKEYCEDTIETKLKSIDCYYASCWIMKEVESYLMWKNYSSYDEGILILTTVGKLLKSLDLRSYESYTNLVRWFYGEIDYGHNLSMEGSDHIVAFGKTRYFEDEKEFRIVQLKNPLENVDYIFTDINEMSFIDKIVLSPNANEEFISLMKGYITSLGIKESIITTSEIRNNNRSILDKFIKNT